MEANAAALESRAATAIETVMEFAIGYHLQRRQCTRKKALGGAHCDLPETRSTHCTCQGPIRHANEQLVFQVTKMLANVAVQTLRLLLRRKREHGSIGMLQPGAEKL